ncbi:MAG: zinc ribbon domain-containing protein [Candidatus Bathyarchaeia archaeon]
MVECPKCGTKNPKDAVYCMSCGSPIEEKETITLKPATPPAVTKPVPGVKVVKPITPGAPITTAAPMRIPSIGSCFYHPSLLAAYLCSRCGRPICRDCAKAHGDLIFCPQCYASSVPQPVAAPPPSGVNWTLVAVAVALVAVAVIGFVAWWLLSI